jgi:hypothetical protein
VETMAEIPYLDDRRRRTRRVNNVSDVLRFLEGGGGDVYLTIFRGQRCDWPLQPKIARVNLLGGTAPEAERLILAAFRREAIPHLGLIPEDEWEWLAIGQHHGLPTRLLDWTKNPLAALWFAVTEPTTEGPGVLWVFQPHQRDLLHSHADESPFDGEEIRVFEPRHVSPRIRAQAGVFTVHKRIGPQHKIPALQEIQAQHRNLLKCVIPPERFATIRGQLMDCGVHAASLFPDLDGVARRIAADHVMSTDIPMM